MKIIINEEYELLNLSLTNVLLQLDLFESLAHRIAAYNGKKEDLIKESIWVQERLLTICCLRDLTEELMVNGLFHKKEYSLVCERLSAILYELDNLKQLYFNAARHFDITILIEKVQHSIRRLCPILMNTEFSRT